MAATSASHFSPQPSAVLLRHRTITASFAINLRHAKSKGQVSARSSQQHSRDLRFKVHSMRQPVNREVTKESWEEKILKSEIPVLVEFHATWCGPCRMVHRVIDEIAEEYAGKLKCWILNTDSDLEIAEDYEIKAVPVVLIFKNGVKKESIVGTMPKEFYIAAIERVLKL